MALKIEPTHSAPTHSTVVFAQSDTSEPALEILYKASSEEEIESFCKQLKTESPEQIRKMISQIFQMFHLESDLESDLGKGAAMQICEELIKNSSADPGEEMNAILEEMGTMLLSAKFSWKISILMKRIIDRGEDAAKETIGKLLSEMISHADEAVRLKALQYSHYPIMLGLVSDSDVQTLIPVAERALRLPGYFRAARTFFKDQIRHKHNEQANRAALSAIRQAIRSEDPDIIEYAFNLLRFSVIPYKLPDMPVAEFLLDVLKAANMIAPDNSIWHREAVSAFGALKGNDIEAHLDQLIPPAKALLYSQKHASDGYHFFLSAIGKQTEEANLAIAEVVDEALASNIPHIKSYVENLQTALNNRWLCWGVAAALK